MFTNTAITVYNYHNGSYHRAEIKEAFWDNVKQSNVMKSGIASADSVSLFIPAETMPKGYAKPKEYNNLQNVTGRYTFQANSKDLVVKGIVNYDFDNTSQATIAEGIKYLKNTYDDVATVSVVDDKRYGDIEMQYIKLSCK